MNERVSDPSRPDLAASLTEHEFRRWYWTLAELKLFAKLIEVGRSGSKAEITERIAAKLGGRQAPVTNRRSTADQITGPLSGDTRVPPNQRATEELRQFFTAEIGPSFRFNDHMRAVLADGDITLDQAIEHWHKTVGTPLPKQSESLEFNRFTKAWHEAHPEGTPQDSRAAWMRYRALPREQRPPVADA